MRLFELERAFWDAARTRGAPPPYLDQLFTASAGLSAPQRFAIYHRAYWQRQVVALGSTFELTRQLLGETGFERMALSYVQRHPGRDPCIERLGGDFAEFLGARAEAPRWLVDLAKLEWARLESLLARDARPLRRPPPGAEFVSCSLELVPSLVCLTVEPTALALFRGEERSGTTDETEVRAIHVALHRARFAVRSWELDEAEARALDLARRGHRVHRVCDAFAHLPEADAIAQAFAILSGWFARGWVSSCTREGQTARSDV